MMMNILKPLQTRNDYTEGDISIPDRSYLRRVCKVLDITPKFCPTDQCGCSLEVFFRVTLLCKSQRGVSSLLF